MFTAAVSGLLAIASMQKLSTTTSAQHDLMSTYAAEVHWRGAYPGVDFSNALCEFAERGQGAAMYRLVHNRGGARGQDGRQAQPAQRVGQQVGKKSKSISRDSRVQKARDGTSCRPTRLTCPQRGAKPRLAFQRTSQNYTVALVWF